MRAGIDRFALRGEEGEALPILATEGELARSEGWLCPAAAGAQPFQVMGQGVLGAEDDGQVPTPAHSARRWRQATLAPGAGAGQFPRSRSLGRRVSAASTNQR